MFNCCDKCNKSGMSSEKGISVTNSFSRDGFPTHWTHSLTFGKDFGARLLKSEAWCHLLKAL